MGRERLSRAPCGGVLTSAGTMSMVARRVDTGGVAPASSLAEAYRACEEIARAHYENFPVVSRLLPKQSRRSLAAVYAFARQADDFADEDYGPSGPTAEARLAAIDDWERRLREACGRDGEASGPSLAAATRPGPHQAEAVFAALADTIRHHDLDTMPFLDLLSAFRQDVLVSRYPTRADLLDYCRRSANPVGRIVLAIHGEKRAGAMIWSDALCTGLQLTNFWQDIAIDAGKGRVYLPTEACLRHGVSVEELHASSAGPRLRALVLEEVSWAREHFENAVPLLRAAPSSLRFHLRIVWQGGARILDKIRESGGDVLAVRPRLVRSDWVRILLRALIPLGPRRGGNGTLDPA